MSNSGVTYLLRVLLGLSVFLLAGQPAGAAALQAEIPQEVLLENGFRVSFEGVDYHTDGTSTWHYSVEELPSAQDLGNWVLETPFCATILEAGPRPWEVVDPDPNAHLSGVKWETGAGFQQGQFWVRLETAGQVGVTNVAAKGPRVASGEIAGPTCVEAEPPIEPPVGAGDTEPPAIEWIEPVRLNERYDLQAGETVELVVNAADNVAVAEVRFIRWDATNNVYVTVAVDEEPPYQATVAADGLNPTWNQVFAASFDSAGNHSEWAWIWLYKAAVGPLFGSAGTSLFLPLLHLIGKFIKRITWILFSDPRNPLSDVLYRHPRPILFIPNCVRRS